MIVCETETLEVDADWLARESVTLQHRAAALSILIQEKQSIEAALAESKGQIAGPSGAAATLGIPRSTLEFGKLDH